MRNASSDGFLDISTGKRLALPEETRLLDIGDLNSYPTDVMKATEGMAGGVAEVVRRGGWSVCLGGDHYVGYPSCLGFCRAAAEANPRVKVGYIHIDGHLDFADESPPNGKYNNGTNARRISEIDVMDPSSMVWIGIQGLCNLNEVEPIRRNGGTIFTSEDIHEMGPAEVGKRAGELAMKGCDYIYMSFDIDVIDAGFSNGTGSVTMGRSDPHGVAEDPGRAGQVSDCRDGPRGELTRAGPFRPHLKDGGGVAVAPHHAENLRHPVGRGAVTQTGRNCPLRDVVERGASCLLERIRYRERREYSPS